VYHKRQRFPTSLEPAIFCEASVDSSRAGNSHFRRVTPAPSGVGLTGSPELPRRNPIDMTDPVKRIADRRTSVKVAGVLLMLALGGGLTFLTTEFLLIALDPYIFRGFFQYDQEIGFRVRPHADGSNQFGFNDRDYPLERTPGTTRMLFLGDSFGWVGGLEENYTAVLEDRLTTRFGSGVEVVNAGFPMTHPGEQLKILEKFGMRYHPDLVVLGFFAGNDFYEAQPERKRIIVNDTYLDIRPDQEWIVLGRPILRRSRVRLLIEQKYRIFQERRLALRSTNPGEVATAGVAIQTGSTEADGATADREEPDSGLYPSGFAEESYLDIETALMRFTSRTEHDAGRYQSRIDHVFESIAAMEERVRASGAEFMVAILPAAFQVDSTLTARIIDRSDLNAHDIDLPMAQRILSEYLDSRGIPYIDLLEGFVEEQRHRRLFIERDTHWNRAGNEVAAEILFESLTPWVETKAGPMLSVFDRSPS